MSNSIGFPIPARTGRSFPWRCALRLLPAILATFFGGLSSRVARGDCPECPWGFNCWDTGEKCIREAKCFAFGECSQEPTLKGKVITDRCHILLCETYVPYVPWWSCKGECNLEVAANCNCDTSLT